MTRTRGLVLLLSVILALGLASVACSPKPAQTTTQDAATRAIQAYADPAAQMMMQAISDKSISKYIQDGNATFKAAVTQAIFDALTAQMEAKYGKFLSIQFLSTEEQQGYIIVHYQAKFEKGQLGLRMVFDKDHLVAGQFFE